MKVSARLKSIRISPKKVRLSANLIRGLDVSEARLMLSNTIKRVNDPMLTLLNSAISNGENNFGLDPDNLYVFDVKLGEGVKMKRWMPRAQGRATKILKRTSNFTLILEERVEGKNRKTKEQLDAERKKRDEEKRKQEEELKKVSEDKKVDDVVEKAKVEISEKEKSSVETRKGSVKKGGWVNKVFRRKSM